MTGRNNGYGECHTCGARMRAKLVDQGFWLKGKLILIEGVPCGVCPRCGEKVVSAATGQRVSAILEEARRRRKVRTIRVPVMQFARNVA